MDATTLRFCQPPPPRMWELSDAEFLQSLAWEPHARSALVKLAAAGDVAAFYCKLQKRGFPGKSARRRRIGPESVPWFFSPSFSETTAEAKRTAELIEVAQRLTGGEHGSKGARSRRAKKISARQGRRRQVGPVRSGSRREGASLSRRGVDQLAGWLDSSPAGDPLSPLELQILLELTRDFGRRLPLDVFRPLWRLSLSAAARLSADLDEPLGSRASDAERMIVQGELPWETGLLFPDVAGAEVLLEFGHGHLSEQLEEKTDTDGTPQAELLEDLPRWLASLVRAQEWAARFGVDLWDNEEADRFREFVKIVAPLCRHDRRLALSNGRTPDAAGLLLAAARMAGWKKKSAPYSYLRAVAGKSGAPAGGRLKPQTAVRRRHRPVTQSDWARLACLRSSWAADADTLVVAHHAELPNIELSPIGRRLLSGAWEIRLVVDGKPRPFDDQWTCICWHSDADADYLEIQFSFDDGVQVERQLLLSRTDRFAVLADAISGANDARIEYSSRQPVVEGVRIESDVPTRECRCRDKGLRARFFPLALPADRVLSTSGGFAPVDGVLELKQVAVGGLYAPLVIDWHPDRRRAAADWRTLTVSEEGRIQKSEAAGAHRLRIGDHQLLLYRSLKEPAVPRAVLGQHTLHETLIGQFDSDGDCEPILIVE